MSFTPEFVVLGAKLTSKGTVIVFASRDLINVEFEEKLEGDFDFYPDSSLYYKSFIRREYTLEMLMSSAVMVEGKTYEEALSKLFGTWSPEGGVREEPKEITPHRKEVGS